MRLKSFIQIIGVLICVGISPAYGVQPDEILDDQVLEARARDLSSQLRCLVCQNQSIDDSDAQLARDLRVLVRQRLVSGDTNSEIIDYVVDRYGEFVLLKPRFNIRNALLWGAPFLLLIIGGTAMFFQAKRSRSAVASSDLSVSERAELDEILKKSGD